MTRTGVAYGLPTWEHHTDGSASSSQPGLLPTPAAGNFNDGESVESWQARKERELAKGCNGNGIGTPLSMAVQLLKTPTAQLGVNGGSQHPDKRRAGGHGPTLADQVEHELLPTPTTRDHKGASARNGRTLTDGSTGAAGGVQLPNVVQLLPTPCATDAKAARNATSGRKPNSQHHSGETLLDVFWTGVTTPPPSDAGG